MQCYGAARTIECMRIAFVGKGGSGKTTLSALFAQYVNKKYPVLAIDADLNMHLGALLGIRGVADRAAYLLSRSGKGH